MKFFVYVAVPVTVFLLVVAGLITASSTIWQHTPQDPTLPEKLSWQETGPERGSSISASSIKVNVVVPVAAVQ